MAFATFSDSSLDDWAWIPCENPSPESAKE
jgi:hypothetical protein